ncbi:MAG: hypothetical protein V1862_09255, partial [Methanobacteriota archaeon]
MGYKCLTAKNKELADILQHICFLAGTVTVLINNDNKYIVKIFHNKFYDKTKKIVKKENIKVWCPSTDDGIVVYRRNGAIFIS